MRVLITGGAGFVGSHLSRYLLERDHSVLVVDDLSTGLARNIAPGALFEQVNICSPLDPVFQGFGPELVVHLAAQVSVPESVVSPAQDLAINVGGTINVLRASRRVGARKVIYLSSAAVYSSSNNLPLTEVSTLAGESPYGLSKLTSEHYVKLLGALWDVNYTILRPANIFGPGQRAHGDGAVVPTFLNRFLAGDDPVIHADGSQTRDFVYVRDVVRAIVQAFDRAAGRTLNISSDCGTSIRELWYLMAGILGWTRPPMFGPARAGDIAHSVMSNQAAQKYLEWTPEVALEQGLAETITWTRMSNVAATTEMATD